jgi:cyclic pyranopterin phosphate synthase
MAGKKLSHVDERGRAKMVDVGAKAVTAREATAEGYVTMAPATLRAIAEERIAKGEVLAVARVAGIMAAKRTSELIPLCHGLAVDSVAVDFDVPTLIPEEGQERCQIRVHATARIQAKTGVEMEALTAVSVAALTIYDMCKAIDKEMTIDGVRLIRKTGGKSDYQAKP